MKTFAWFSTALFAALLAAGGAAAQPSAPGNFSAVPRYDADITMQLSWNDGAVNEDNFEIQRREIGGSFAFLTSVGPNVQAFEDLTATGDREWEYRIRARSAADGNSAWVGPTTRMRPRQVWPMPDDDHDILHSFGTPLNFGANRQYFHEGVDISSSNVRVDAARGGQVTVVNPNSFNGGTMSIRVDMGGAGNVTESYGHITPDPALSVGDFLSPGDQVGTVRNDWFNRAFEADHVHWGNSQTNKLIPFTDPADRDPNEMAPRIADINNDGEDFILVDATNNNHLSPLTNASRDVDFLVDAFDDMAPTNDLMVAPFSLGYWITSTVSGATPVQSAGMPYRLVTYDYPLIGPNPAGARENATSYWPLDADIQGINTWQSTLTFILSNASNTAGDTNSPQAGEFWRTDARAGTGTRANGSDAQRARENQEAAFPDGEYFVNIIADDLVHSTTAQRRVLVDNSRPYVKAVRVRSGAALVYTSEWEWDTASGQVDISPATFDAASGFPASRTRNVNIEIEFSEPMETAAIAQVTPLGTAPNLASEQPEGRRTIWQGTISHLDIDDAGADDGTHMMSITGTDLAGNALLQIADRDPLPGNGHNRDASRNLRGASGQDSIHGFEIGFIEGLQNVTAIFMRDAATDPAAPEIADKAAELTTWLNDYFDEASYGNVSFQVAGVGWYALDDPLGSYYVNPRTPLVDLVQEAVEDAEADGVDLTGSDYILVVTDETAPRDEWSTTGGWPYETDDGTQVMASGVLNLASPRERVSNLAGRMIGFVDLFAYPGVTVPRPFVGAWSHWSDRDTDVHPLGWEKWRAGWLSEAANADHGVTRLPKPPIPSPIVNRQIDIGATDSDTDETKAVAVEIADDVHVMIEYRRLEGLDADLPDAGVVISRANDRVAQGEGPVILTESNVTAGDLSDAPFLSSGPRSTFSDPGTGLTVTILSIAADTARVRIDYAVPPFENDVYVADHDDRWKTIDIWVDAPDLAGGFSADPRTVIADSERPVIGALNKLIGRVRNNGAADASNFEVELEVLEPWGTDGNWTQLDVRTVPLLEGTVNDANDDFLIVADWTPVQSGHTCVRLRTRAVPNDVDDTNNFTQENIHEFTSVSGSPYQPVVSRFQVKNPFAQRLPILFRVDGLPDGWTADISPRRPVLDPDEVTMAQIVVQPLEGAPHCLREEITVTAYAPQVDTLKSVGAITLGVGLKAPATVTHRNWTDCDCDCPDNQRERQCRVYTSGCTDPGLPNTAVEILYAAPDGTKEVRTVFTDAEGCFVDFLPRNAQPGTWQTTVQIEENQCRAGDLDGPIRVAVTDPPPTPPDRECDALKERLQVLTKRFQEAIEAGQKDVFEQLFGQAIEFLRSGQSCPELREELAQLYEKLLSVAFAGDFEAAKEIIERIFSLLET